MGKHEQIMQAESIAGDQSLVSLAMEYHQWATDEADSRLAVLESFAMGEQLLTTMGMRQCFDAFLGISHIGILVHSAVERHEAVVPALRGKTYQYLCFCVGKAKGYYDDLKAIGDSVESPDAD